MGRRKTQDEKPVLDQLDRLLVSCAMDLIFQTLDHLVRGEMFVAGRYHKRAEETASKIVSDEHRAVAQALCTSTFNQAVSLCAKMAESSRRGIAADLAQKELIELMLGSEVWCQERGDEAVEQLRFRHADVVARIARERSRT